MSDFDNRKGQKMVDIDKGVPRPGRGRTGKYPWREMEVGDSFLVLNCNADGFAQSRGATRTYAPKRWSARAEGVNLRVWWVE